MAFDRSAVALPFYIFPETHNGLNTFSRERADLVVQKSGLNYQTVSIPMVSVNEIMEKHFSHASSPLHLLSMDVEGLEFQMLKTVDFSRHRPWVLCIESDQDDFGTTKNYSEDPIISYLCEKDYIFVASTSINYIFFCSERVFFS